jgi:hypothetical protein
MLIQVGVQNKQIGSMAFSPQANYTGRAAIEVSANFSSRGVAWSVQQSPTAVNLGFLEYSLTKISQF